MFIEVLQKGEYDKFISMFPQDREARIKVVKMVAHVLSTLDSLKSVVVTKDFYRKENYLNSSEFYEVLALKFSFLKIGYNKEMIIIMGEDDSGAWIEILNRGASRQRFDFLEIKELLHAGDYLEGDVIEKKGFYRVQGDVNIGYLPFDVDGTNNEMLEILKLMPDTLNLDKGYRKEATSDTVWRANLIANIKKFADFVDKVNEDMTITFENHVFKLNGTSYPITSFYERMNSLLFIVGSQGAEITISSEHHNKRALQLFEGLYYIAKSGGATLEDIESSLSNFREKEVNR
ncbi:MAG: hypothetical protein QXL94_04380 [Candidatus Parvarchaeum sp.]